MKKTLFLNDTSNELHIGSSSISLFIKDRLKNTSLESVGYVNEEYSISHLNGYDLVVVNAEGTLSRPTERAMKLVESIKSIKCDCPIIVLNADICSEVANEISSIEFSFVHYRRKHSDSEFLSHASHIYLPDMFYMICRSEAHKLKSEHNDSQRMVISDSHNKSDVNELFGFMEEYSEKIDFYEQSMLVEYDNRLGCLVSKSDIIKNRLWFLSKSPLARWRKKNSEFKFDKWLLELRNSKMLLTGRFHHIVAALALGVPVVYLETQTKKMEKLSEFFPEATINKLSDFDISQIDNYTLSYAPSEFDYSEILGWIG